MNTRHFAKSFPGTQIMKLHRNQAISLAAVLLGALLAIALSGAVALARAQGVESFPTRSIRCRRDPLPTSRCSLEHPVYDACPMKIKKHIRLGGTFAAAILAASASATAQQITGTPGSPSATQVIDGNQLSPPALPFGGVIKENADDKLTFKLGPSHMAAADKKVAEQQLARAHD
jgi:hypothetical protein